MEIEEIICYKEMSDRVNDFKSEELRVKLLEYYVRECRKRFKSGKYKSFSSHFYEFISMINTSQIEYYIEYCLLFHEKDFYDFLSAVYKICIDFNIILKDMCCCFYRYNSIKDVEQQFSDIKVPRAKNLEVQQLIQDVIEAEKEYVLLCYEFASKGIDFCDICMPNCPNKKVLQSIQRIKSDDLREKLSEYYLENYSKRHNTYSSDGGFTLWHKLNVNFAKWMNELNTPELEYFIDYCLSFHEDDFIIFMEYVYLICSQFNLELKGMCSSYLRYSGKETKEKVFDSIMIPKCHIVEINQLIDCVFETEKQHFINCYELAKNNETFCENCIPYCLVKTEDGKQFKRTVPNRG